MSLYAGSTVDFSCPESIDFDNDGNYYIADSCHHNIKFFDKEKNKWSIIGEQGSNPGQFNTPVGIAVDSNSNIYVSESYGERIQKFDNLTQTWSVIATGGTGVGQVSAVYYINLDNHDNLFIAEQPSNSISNDARVQKYDTSNGTWSVVYENSDGDNRGKWVWGVAVRDNDLYLACEGPNPIEKYNMQTGELTAVAAYGADLNQVDIAYGIELDSSGNLYVMDWGNRVLKRRDAVSGDWSVFAGDEMFTNYSLNLALDKNNNIFISNMWTEVVQKLWYYDMAEYSAGENGKVVGSTTQKLSDGQRGKPVIAVPDRGYTFLSWSDGSTSNPRRDIGGSGPIIVTANFTNRKNVNEIVAGLFAAEISNQNISLGSTNPESTPLFVFNINYTFKAGDAEIVFPADTVVTSTEGGNLDLTQFATTENTDTVKAVLTQALAAVQVGIPNEKLTFSKAITITIPVGASYNGQTLEIKYKREGEDTWNVEGTCTVSSGNCTFQTTHATTFAALGPTDSSGDDNSSNDSNSSNSTPVSVSSTPDHSCHSSKPLFTSDLFQINTTTNSAKIYFTPQADTNNYVISFSTNPNAEEHGEQVSLLREGVQSHTIYYLKPNTTYYVKVRGQNACMPGEWSNIMKFKTNSTIYYKSGLTTFVSNVKSLVKSTVTKKTDTATKTDDLKEDKTNISTDTSSNQTNNKTVETSSSTNQQRTETPKAKKCFLWWCW